MVPLFDRKLEDIPNALLVQKFEEEFHISPAINACFGVRLLMSSLLELDGHIGEANKLKDLVELGRAEYRPEAILANIAWQSIVVKVYLDVFSSIESVQSFILRATVSCKDAIVISHTFWVRAV